MSSTTLLVLILILALVLFLLVALFLRRRRLAKTTPSAAKKEKPAKAGSKKPAAAPVTPTAPPGRTKQTKQPPAGVPAVSAPAPAAPVPAKPQPLEAGSDLGAGDKIRILVVDDNPDTRGHVSRLLYFEEDMEVIGQATNGRQGIEMAIEFRPHIVLMDINMPDVDGITATQEMSIKAPYSQVIIMTVQAEQHYMKKAMAAGARDFQPKPFTSDELVSCVRRVYNFSLPIYQQLEAARQAEAKQVAQVKAETAHMATGTPVIAIYSPKGGIGTSTIAANLAVALQQRYGDVVLMDAALQFGDAMVHLNTRPTRTMTDLVHDEGYDLELLADVLLPHNSGLKLLLAPAQPELADSISAEMVAALVERLKGQFRAVLVDTSTKLDDKTMAVLENADYILLVISPELPAIKSGKLFLELFDRLEFGRDRIGVIINSADEIGGVSPTKIERILKLERTYQIPYDPRLILAVNRGVAVTQQEPNTAAAQAIIQLANEIGQKLSEPKDVLPIIEQD